MRVTEPSGMPFDCAKFEIVEEDWPPAELERAKAVAAGHEPWLAAEV